MHQPFATLLLFVLVSAPATATTLHAQIDASKLYEKQCAACHGMDGSGDTPLGKSLKPVPARDLRPTILTMADIRQVLKQGSPKTGMHGHESHLDVSQIDAIAAFVRSLPYQSKPQRGKRYYQNKCARCHGSNARGLSKVASPDLLISELSDEQMAKIIRDGHPGTIMGGMKRELGNAVIADIITWLRLLRYGLHD
ncbi:MAG: c-type cytochrome [Mariprofundaceae bacterium]